MTRGLIVGAIAFAAAFACRTDLHQRMAPDIALLAIRCARCRGQEPLFKDLVSFVKAQFGGGVRAGIVADLTNDAVRYARMKGM